MNNVWILYDSIKIKKNYTFFKLYFVYIITINVQNGDLQPQYKHCIYDTLTDVLSEKFQNYCKSYKSTCVHSFVNSFRVLTRVVYTKLLICSHKKNQGTSNPPSSFTVYHMHFCKLFVRVVHDDWIDLWLIVAIRDL